jgi:multiple sugar transport system permease protein
MMFLIILALSMLVLKSSSAWVHYEGEVKGGGNG